MLAIKQILYVQDGKIVIDVPKEFLHQMVEVIILPQNDSKSTNQISNSFSKEKSVAGSLHKYANPDLIEKEIDIAWNNIDK